MPSLDPANVASGRVMDKLGFQFLRASRMPGTDEVVHVRELRRPTRTR